MATVRQARVVAVGHRNGVVDEVLLVFPDGGHLTITTWPYGGDFDTAKEMQVQEEGPNG